MTGARLTVRERMLGIVGSGNASIQKLRSELKDQHPSIVDCALAGLMRDGLLVNIDGEYRRPDAGSGSRKPRP